MLLCNPWFMRAKVSDATRHPDLLAWDIRNKHCFRSRHHQPQDSVQKHEQNVLKENRLVDSLLILYLRVLTLCIAQFRSSNTTREPDCVFNWVYHPCSGLSVSSPPDLLQVGPASLICSARWSPCIAISCHSLLLSAVHRCFSRYFLTVSFHLNFGLPLLLFIYLFCFQCSLCQSFLTHAPHTSCLSQFVPTT